MSLREQYKAIQVDKIDQIDTDENKGTILYAVIDFDGSEETCDKVFLYRGDAEEYIKSIVGENHLDIRPYTVLADTKLSKGMPVYVNTYCWMIDASEVIGIDTFPTPDEEREYYQEEFVIQ